MQVKNQRPSYEPTPEQIAAELLKIRSGWTEAQRRERDNHPATDWQVPVVRIQELGE